MTRVTNPSFFGVGIGYALIFMLLAIATDAIVNALLLLGLMVGFLVGSFFHRKGMERVGVHVGVAAMISYQAVLLYVYRDVPNVGVVWFIAGPAIIARIGRAKDILIWTPISVLATVVSFTYVAQYPVMQHPMSLANLLGVLTLTAFVSYFFVSEKQKREAELIESLEGAEHAERRSTRFLSTLSHELRTPMTSILLSAETLRTSKELNQEDKAAVERLYSAASVTTNVLNDVLELAKIEANLGSLVRQDFNIEELLSELKTTLTPLAVSHRCTLLFLAMPDTPAQWHSGFSSLRQILGNLIGNAIKHSPDGRVTVSFVRETNHLDVLVGDTGPGIAPQYQKEIFEPFISLSGASGVGTGLGLTLARRYAHILNCEVNLVTSEIDKGSVFGLRVPKAEYSDAGLAQLLQFPELKLKPMILDLDNAEQANWVSAWCEAWGMSDTNVSVASQIAASFRITNSVVDLPSLRIALGVESSIDKPTAIKAETQTSEQFGACLICDDNELIREVFSVILVAAGFEVVTVGDEAQAFDALASHHFDFMILDVQLEHSSGVDLLSKMREMETSYANIPVCMISGSLNGKEQASKVGADHYLLKPPSKAEIESMAEQLMQLSSRTN